MSAVAYSSVLQIAGLKSSQNAFSDHLGLLMEVRAPINAHITSPIPRGQAHLKIRDEVAHDPKFQEIVALGMENWKEIRNNGLDVLT